MSSELSTNQEIEGLFDELFPFPRSITGDCQTLFLQDLRDLHASCPASDPSVYGVNIGCFDEINIRDYLTTDIKDGVSMSFVADHTDC